jgi:hypothetical protein
VASAQPIPIACDLKAFLPDERTRWAGLVDRVVSQVRGRAELPDGFALTLDATAELAREVLDWILLESRCCPFLGFELRLGPGAQTLEVRLRGGPGVKEFLATTPLGSSSLSRSVCC